MGCGEELVGMLWCEAHTPVRGVVTVVFVWCLHTVCAVRRLLRRRTGVPVSCACHARACGAVWCADSSCTSGSEVQRRPQTCYCSVLLLASRSREVRLECTVIDLDLRSEVGASYSSVHG